MNKPRALFLDKTSLFPDDLDFSILESIANWHWIDNAGVDASCVRQGYGDAEIIVTNKVIVSKADIEANIAENGHLKLICVAATGVNNVDIAAAQQHGIKVCNVRGYATSSVAQHVFSLILALNRKLFSYQQSVNDGSWSESDFFCYFGSPISGLEGKTLGIVGYGELGQAVAKLAKCFAMEVLIAHAHNAGDGVRNKADLSDGRVDLMTLLSESDVVSLHCPLTENNRHMISEKELSVMKTDAILVNAARGGLIDEQALLSALKNAEIGAAALDVLEEEPPSVENPLVSYRQDNLIITPHIAWASSESRQKLVNEIAKNIQAYLQGQLRNIV